MKDVIMRCPGKNDIDKLKALWSEVFSSVGMDAFFSDLYGNELCGAVFSDNELCAMGYLVPAGELLCEGKTLGCAMIYSVATAPLFRGRGYAKAVVRQLITKAHSSGYPVVMLSPSEDTLFEYYRSSSGFNDWFYADGQVYTKAQLPASPGKRVIQENVSAVGYVRLRESLLSGTTYVKQDVCILEYQSKICDEVGGGLYRIGDSCAVIEIQDDMSVLIKELLSPADAQSEVLAAIADTYPSHKYTVRTPATGKNKKRFGMIKTEKGDLPNARSGGPLPWYGLALD